MISPKRMPDSLSENISLHDEPKSFYEHLADLRGCLVRCVAALLICTIAAFPFQKLWLKVLVYPGSQSLKSLTWLNPPDIFISGHSHILKIMPDNKLNLLHINPGAAGRSGLHKLRTIVIMELKNKMIENMNVVEMEKWNKTVNY